MSILPMHRYLFIAQRVLNAGGRLVDLNHIEADFSGGCKNPRLLTLEFRYLDAQEFCCTAAKSLVTNEFPRKFIDMYVPCRCCEHCLYKRARLWTNRALTQLSLSQRTWFVTLTVEPAVHYAISCVPGFDRLDERHQFWCRHRELSKEITKFFKRIRKNSGAKLKYILVCERHASGLPHYHCLLHELRGSQPLTKRVLQKGWRYGYSAAKLVDDEGTARYICKYLAKDNLARVRASIAYGDGSPSEWSAALEAASKGDAL